MRDYIQYNLAAYENTAEEFQTKKETRLEADIQLADTFISQLKTGKRVLELGIGSGQLARLLGERQLRVEAIEYSPRMAELAQQTAPDTRIIVDEFLRHNFAGKQYDGVIGVAFIHLFSSADAERAMMKIKNLLVPGGVLMLSTTVHDKTHDDFVKKSNFKTEAYRYRKHYSIKDFKALIIKVGLEIISVTTNKDREVPGKIWAIVVATKSVKR
jgi:cyclopropane fatty-acyl-phospholipid synthase-like methyltransferase